MKNNNTVLANRITVIRGMAADICTITKDERLTDDVKFHEITYFICEMIKTALGHESCFE